MDNVEARDHSGQCHEQDAKQSLLEIMRPRTLSDLALPTRITERLQRMIEKDSIMNMLFYGKIGTGKTSAALQFDSGADRWIMRGSAHLFMQWDGLDLKNVDFVKKDMKRSLYSADLFLGDNFKICFIDRADLIPEKAQQAIPSVMDDLSGHCRFIFAVNYPSKIIPEIRSRLMPVCFDIKPCEREEVQERLIDRYERKLAENGIVPDKRRLAEIVAADYPDLRSITKKIEFELA